MKRILFMALASMVFFSAEAQQKTTEVCRISSKKSSCYTTKYSENYPVCKSDKGYCICGEKPGYANSTIKSDYRVANQVAVNNSDIDSYDEDVTMKSSGSDETTSNTDLAEESGIPVAMVAPQSQSYPIINVGVASAFEGYYPKQHKIKVSYSDNVADDNRAPYEGQPSPAYDGPQKNIQRNLNECNPNADLAPVTGRPE